MYVTQYKLEIMHITCSTYILKQDWLFCKLPEVLGFWGNLVNPTTNKLSKSVYMKSLGTVNPKWNRYVRDWLLKLDMNDVWEDQIVLNHYAFKQKVRTKLFALQNEEFLASCTSSKTRLYKMLVEEHSNTVCPWYLDHMVDSAKYHALAAIRLCSHSSH